MAIIDFQLDTIGQEGKNPSIIYLQTNNTVAEVTTAGYLNTFVAQGNFVSDLKIACVSTKTSPSAFASDVNWYNISYSGGDWSLSETIPAGSVTVQGTPTVGALVAFASANSIEDAVSQPSNAAIPTLASVDSPTTSGNIPFFSDNVGTISDDNAVTRSGPYTILAAVAAAVTVNAIPKFIDTVGSIQDGYEVSDATKSTVVMAGGATVVGTVPKFIDTAGTIDDGFVPSNAAKTTIVMATAATTVNAIPKFTDIAGTVGDGYAPSDATKTTAVMATGALGSYTANHLLKSGDTNGTASDAGFTLVSGTTAAYAGGGTSNAYAAPGLTGASIVTASILSFTNNVTITKITPGTNTLTVFFAADPGGNTVIMYHAFTA